MNDKISDLFPAGLDDGHMAATVERAEIGYRPALPVARKIVEGEPRRNGAIQAARGHEEGGCGLAKSMDAPARRASHATRDAPGAM